MKQSLLIFRKDARCLRLEITVFVLFAAIYSRFGGAISGPDILLEIAAIWLIARVVHAEPIVGDRQFWLTRPYDWRSLLSAKLLFVAGFVCIPIGLAQLAMLVTGRFPILPSVPGLLWSQAAAFAVGALVAALAAMTSGTTTFMLTVLGLAALIGVAETATSWLILHRPSFPAPFVWVREYSILAIFTLSAACICLWQYRDRATLRSWLTVTGGLVLTTLVLLFMPASFAIAAQSFLSGETNAAVAIKAAVDPGMKGNGTEIIRSGMDPLYRRVRIAIPIAFQGVPENEEVRADALSVRLEWPGSPAWIPDVPPGLNKRSGSLSEASLLMDTARYRARRDAPLTITGAVYVTLFGDSQARTAEMRNQPVNFQDGLQCGIGPFDTLYCRSLFRWPARLVYVTSGAMEDELQNTLISYSPFPAELSLNSMEARTAGTLRGNQLTIVTKRPLNHFWVNVRVSGVRLSDFEGPARPIER